MLTLTCKNILIYVDHTNFLKRHICLKESIVVMFCMIEHNSLDKSNRLVLGGRLVVLRGGARVPRKILS